MNLHSGIPSSYFMHLLRYLLVSQPQRFGTQKTVATDASEFSCCTTKSISVNFVQQARHGKNYRQAKHKGNQQQRHSKPSHFSVSP